MEDRLMAAQHTSAFEIDAVPMITRHDADRLGLPVGAETLAPPDVDPLYDELDLPPSRQAWMWWTILGGVALAATIASALAALS
jgi:hypothetical protein